MLLVLDEARRIIETGKQDVLAQALKDRGITRVSLCPPEKSAELLKFLKTV
jgi:ABC-type uncharacterized transport system fused permease/ATPase subunit